ncbi:hypothetical protein DFJ74DRAFT_762660 [Hyaloraphidium curvatum]|nr:hypothetical protein DFJ74DRAFT_762660 [Hyaloraphidium curvatum]
MYRGWRVLSASDRDLMSWRSPQFPPSPARIATMAQDPSDAVLGRDIPSIGFVICETPPGGATRVPTELLRVGATILSDPQSHAAFRRFETLFGNASRISAQVCLAFLAYCSRIGLPPDDYWIEAAKAFAVAVWRSQDTEPGSRTSFVTEMSDVPGFCTFIAEIEGKLLGPALSESVRLQGDSTRESEKHAFVSTGLFVLEDIALDVHERHVAAEDTPPEGSSPFFRTPCLICGARTTRLSTVYLLSRKEGGGRPIFSFFAMATGAMCGSPPCPPEAQKVLRAVLRAKTAGRPPRPRRCRLLVLQGGREKGIHEEVREVQKDDVLLAGVPEGGLAWTTGSCATRRAGRYQ